MKRIFVSVMCCLLFLGIQQVVAMPFQLSTDKVFTEEEVVQVNFNWVGTTTIKATNLRLALYQLPDPSILFDAGFLKSKDAFLDDNLIAQLPLKKEWSKLLSSNQREVLFVDKLPSGCYVLEAIHEQERVQIPIFVSNYALIASQLNHELLGMVLDRSAQQMLEGYQIRFYRSGEFLKPDKTKEGVAHFIFDGEKEASEGMAHSISPSLNLIRRGGILVAQKDKELIVSDAWFISMYNKQGGIYKALFITDRPAYRPEQWVHFKGVYRWRPHDTWEVFNDSVKYEVRKDGVSLYTRKVKLGANGTFSDSLYIEKDMRLGKYEIQNRVIYPGDADYKEVKLVSAITQFQVEEYKKPEFEVLVNLDKKQYEDGDSMKVVVEAKYYFGAPVANGLLVYSLEKEEYAIPWYCNHPHAWWYEDRINSVLPRNPTTVYMGSDDLDEEGKYEIIIPKSDLLTGGDNTKWTFKALVVDDSRNAVSGGAIAHTLHRSFSLQVKEMNNFYEEGEPVKFTVVATNFSKEPVATTIRAYVKKDNEVIDTLVLKSNEQGEVTFLYKPTDLGRYEFLLEAYDEKKREVRTTVYCKVITSSFVKRKGNSYLEFDKNIYRPGETATLSACFIFEEQTDAIVVLHNQAIVDYYKYVLRSNDLKDKNAKANIEHEFMEFPIPEDAYGQYKVSVFAFIGGKWKQHEVAFMVEPFHKMLQVALQFDEEEYQPGNTATATLQVKDQDGKPVPNADVCLSTYDEAIQFLYPDQNKALHQIFYSPNEYAPNIGTSQAGFQLQRIVDTLSDYSLNVREETIGKSFERGRWLSSADWFQVNDFNKTWNTKHPVLYGYVIDEETNEGIPNASITFGSKTFNCDENGFYAIIGFTLSHTDITFAANGKKAQVNNIAIPFENRDVVLNVSLGGTDNKEVLLNKVEERKVLPAFNEMEIDIESPESFLQALEIDAIAEKQAIPEEQGVLQGKIYYLNNGRAAENVKVHLFELRRNEEPDTIQTISTNATGEYLFEELELRTRYTIVIEKAAYCKLSLAWSFVGQDLKNKTGTIQFDIPIWNDFVDLANYLPNWYTGGYFLEIPDKGRINGSIRGGRNSKSTTYGTANSYSSNYSTLYSNSYTHNTHVLRMDVVNAPIYAVPPPPPPPPPPSMPRHDPLYGVTDGIEISENENESGELPKLVDAQLRTNFQDAIYWNPNITTNAKGEAPVKIKLPDNLTNWRSVAWVITPDTKVGQHHVRTVVKKDLLVRMETPRFLTQGDELLIATNAHNYLNKGKQVHFKLETKGLAQSEKEAQVKIKAGEKERVDWKVSAPYTGLTTLNVEALTNEESDAMQAKVPVQAQGLEMIESDFVKLSDTETQMIKVNLDPSTDLQAAELQINIAPSIAATLLSSLDDLADYPYGCVEQTMNRFLPTVIVANTLQELGQDVPQSISKATLDKMVEKGLKRLKTLQRPNGGWGWWSNDQPNTQFTAYVLSGLIKAQDAGYEVDQQMLDMGRRILENRTQYAYQERYQMDLSRVFLTAFKMNSVEAYADWVELDKDSIYHYSTNPFEQANWLQVAILQKEDSMKQVMLERIEASVTKLGNSMAFWQYKKKENIRRWYNDPVEITANVVKALLQIDPNHPLIPPATQWLLTKRQGKSWHNTRQTAIVIDCLVPLIKEELHPDYNLLVKVNGEEVFQQQFTQKNIYQKGKTIRLKSQQFLASLDPELLDTNNDSNKLLEVGENTIEIIQKGKGASYNTTQLHYFASPDQLAQLDKEAAIFEVRQTYYLLEQVRDTLSGFFFYRRKAIEKQEIKSGDLIEVNNELWLEEAQEFLLIEHPIPAGCEFVKDKASLQIEHLQDGQQYIISDIRKNHQFAYQEFRDNRLVLTATSLGANEERASASYSYLLRAQIPGKYHVNPSSTRLMYFPEVVGWSDMRVLEIIVPLD